MGEWARWVRPVFIASGGRERERETMCTAWRLERDRERGAWGSS